MKEIYEKPVMEIDAIEDDVICTSCTTHWCPAETTPIPIGGDFHF